MKKGFVGGLIPNWIIILLVALLIIVIFFMPPNGLVYKAWKQSEQVTQALPDERTVQLQTKDLDTINTALTTLFREPLNRPCVGFHTKNEWLDVPKNHELVLTRDGLSSYALTLRTTTTPAQIVDVKTVKKELCVVLGASAQQFYNNYLQASTLGKSPPDADPVIQTFVIGDTLALTTSLGKETYLWMGHETDARYMYYPTVPETYCFIPVENTFLPLGCDVGSKALREQCANRLIVALSAQKEHICRFP